MAQCLNANVEAAQYDDKLYTSMRMAQQKQANFDTDRDIGMGWLIEKNGLLWHNGGTGGFRSFMGFDPTSKNGVVVLSNSVDEVDSMGMKIFQLLQSTK